MTVSMNQLFTAALAELLEKISGVHDSNGLGIRDYMYNPEYFVPSSDEGAFDNHDDFMFALGEQLRELATLNINNDDSPLSIDKISAQREVIVALLKANTDHGIDVENFVANIDDAMQSGLQEIREDALKEREHIPYDNRGLVSFAERVEQAHHNPFDPRRTLDDGFKR